MLKRAIKLLSIFAIATLMLVANSTKTNAQEELWYAPTHGEFNHKVYDANPEEIFGERYTQAQVFWIVYSLMNLPNSGAFQKCISEDMAALPIDATDQAKEQALNTCTGQTGSLGPMLDLARFADTIKNTKPASGVNYLAEKLNIVDEAHAQTGSGVGYTTLSGAQYLWGAARNMAYALMVLVVIILAFGIMLRVKLNPQTVITIQSALPRVVIALIAITFSFAIAGLLIDLSFLVQGAISSFIFASGLIKTTGDNAIDLPAFLRIVNSPAEGILGYGGMVVIVALAPAVIGSLASIPFMGVGSATAVIGGIVFLLLIMLVFLIALLKLVWLFLRTYAILMINIVFAPFIILGGAVNTGPGLMGWMKIIIAQLSVFVVATILILMAHIFMWGSNFAGNGATGENVFALSPLLNPFHIETVTVGSLGAAVVPGLGYLDPGLMGFLVGLVLLLSAPAIASLVRDSISKPARLDLGIGETTAIPRQMAIGRFGDTSKVELGAKLNDETISQHLATLPPSERAKYRASYAARKILGGK